MGHIEGTERKNKFYVHKYTYTIRYIRHDTHDTIIFTDNDKSNRMQYREYLFVLSTSSASLFIVKSNGIPSGHGTPHHRPTELGECLNATVVCERMRACLL